MSRMIRLIVALVVAAMGFAGVMQQAGAQAENGTVSVLNYDCTYLDTTMQVEAIDINACSPGAATYTFYLIGDGTNDFQQLAVDASGQGSIFLPSGSYDVVQEESQVHFTVAVEPGQNTQLLVGNPAAAPVPTETPVATGTVTVQNYYCTYLDSTLLVEAIDQAQCSPGAATFTFYLVGDGTNTFQQVTTGADGQGAIDLAVGSYDMVAEETQTHFAVNVLAGENVVMLIGNPAAIMTPTAPAPAPTAVPSATQPAGTVKLPNTGAGVANDSSALTLAMTAAAVIAGGGALTVRKIRKG